MDRLSEETKKPNGLTTRKGLNLAGRHDHRWSCPGTLEPTGRAAGQRSSWQRKSAASSARTVRNRCTRTRMYGSVGGGGSNPPADPIERSRYAAARTGPLRPRTSHAGGLVLHWPLTEASTGCWRSTWAMMPTPPAPCAASSPGRSTPETRIAFVHWPCKEALSVTFEAGCENKCASPYIGERFGENSVGGKWLMGAVLRIALTLAGRGKGAVGG